MSAAQLFLVPVVTVGKIVLVAASGIVIARCFSEPVKSVKGLTYISVRILLPCLLFSNLCLAVTWQSLGTYYWGPIMSVVPMLLGYGSSILFRFFLDKEWHGVLTLGCTFQNGLMFPLTVVLTLKGVPWLTDEGVLEAQRLMFLYNILPSCGLWAIGETIIRMYSRRLTRAEAAHEQPHEAAAPIRLQNGDMDAAAQPAGGSSCTAGLRAKASAVGHVMLQSAKIPPVACSLLALLISLVPPLRWLMELAAGRIVLGGMKGIGSGCIPLQLLILGCSLANVGGNKSKGKGKQEAAQTETNSHSNAATATDAGDANNNNNNNNVSTTTQGAEVHDAAAVSRAAQADEGVIVVAAEDHTQGSLFQRLRRLLRRIPQVALFYGLTCTLRLVLVPAASVLVVHLLHLAHLLPVDRAFFLPLLIGLTSPTAINSSMICSMYNYHAMEYARMIFLQYICAIFTATMWLMVTLWYIETYVPDTSPTLAA